MSRIDALYEAARRAEENSHPTHPGLPCPWDEFAHLADPQTVMALIAVYRAASELGPPQDTRLAPETATLRAAIEKVEGLR